MEKFAWLGLLCVGVAMTGACEITFTLPSPCNLGGTEHGTIEDAGTSHGFSVDAGAIGRDAAPQLDAAVVPADAAMPRDAAADALPDSPASRVDGGAGVGSVGDAGRPADGGGDATSVADAPNYALATATSPSQCWGRHLAATNEYVRMAAMGMSVWHICYHTPLWDAVIPGADPRPARVVFYRYDSEMCTMVDFVDALPAGGSSNPWTANIMVALPTAVPGYPPYFNIANERLGGAEPDIIWAVQENDVGSGRLALNGIIQVWRVGADGSQTLYQPGMTCTDPTGGMVTNRANFFVPSSEIVSDRAPEAACGATPYACSLIPH